MSAPKTSTSVTGSSSSSGNSGSTITGALTAFVQRLQDVKFLSICTVDGAEVASAQGSEYSPENTTLVSSLVPGFSVSVDQASKLGLGASEYSLSWVGEKEQAILLQFKIDIVVLSLLLRPGANVGLVEEHASTLCEALRPYVRGFMPDGHI